MSKVLILLVLAVAFASANDSAIVSEDDQPYTFSIHRLLGKYLNLNFV